MIIFIRLLMRRRIPFGKGPGPVRSVRVTRKWWLPSAALAFGILGALQPVHGECLSPSAAGATTTTTVYRCPDQGKADLQAPRGAPDKTTVVQRGPSDVPWFEPKPADKTAAPLTAPAGEMANPEKEHPPKAKSVRETVEPTAPATETASAERAERTLPAKARAAHRKIAKLKPAKTRTMKALAPRVKHRKKTPKGEPAKSDSNTVVWTRKDMPLGNRVASWLGL